MPTVSRYIGIRTLFLGAIILLVLGTLASAQVMQERTQRIQQSGSDAPVTSITSDDRAVQAERQVTSDDTVRRTLQDQPRSDTTLANQRSGSRNYQDTSVARPAASSNPESQGAVTRNDIRELCEGGYHPIFFREQGLSPDVCTAYMGQDRNEDVVDDRAGRTDREQQTTRDRNEVTTEAEIRRMCEQGYSPVFFRERGLSPDVCDQYEDRRQNTRTVRTEDEQAVEERPRDRTRVREQTRQREDQRVRQTDRGRSRTQISVRQQASAHGEGSVIVQQIIVTLNSLVGDRSVETRTAIRGNDIGAAQRADLDDRNIRTNQRTQSRDRSVVRSQQTDRSGVVAGTDRQSGGGGCVSHTHSHGWETHHGEYHVGEHTHSHVHCR